MPLVLGRAGKYYYPHSFTALSSQLLWSAVKMQFLSTSSLLRSLVFLLALVTLSAGELQTSKTGSESLNFQHKVVRCEHVINSISNVNRTCYLEPLSIELSYFAFQM